MPNNWTEDDVKRATLRYLKGYYRHRPRKGETKSSIDMQGEGDIIADGYLSFVKEDGKVFTATFEATSYDSRQELEFQPLSVKLFFDSFAVGSLLTAFILGVLHYFEFFLFQEVGLFFSITILMAAIGLSALLYKYFFQSFFNISRYRYIYAIEQFKNYFADEQWIAFAIDVFPPNLKDKYFRELKRQCIRNGFGLIRLEADLEPRLLASPSMVEVSTVQRRIIRFFSTEEIQSRLNLPKDSRMLQKILAPIFPKVEIGEKSMDLLRFQKWPWNQVAILLLSIILMATLLAVQWLNGPIVYVNEKQYAKELLAKEKEKEPTYYDVDTPTEPGVLPEAHKSIYDHSAKIDLSKRRVDVEEDTVEEVIPEEEPIVEPPLLEPRDILIRTGKTSNLLYYDCARIPYTDTTRYIVEDTIVINLNDARMRVNQLGDADFEVTAIWRGCYSSQKTGYLVFFGPFYPDSLTAATEVLYLETAVSARNLSSRLRARKFR